MTFTTDSALLSPCLRHVRFFWFLLQILNYCHPAKDGLDFYSFHGRFSIIVIPPEVGWIFMAFIIDSQLLLSCLRKVGFLRLLLQILNYSHPAKGGLDFYGFHYKFSIISFMAFITDSQLLSPRLIRVRFLLFSLPISLIFIYSYIWWLWSISELG